MTKLIEGTEAGHVCNRNGCLGIIKEKDREGCSCHINPPCGSCTTDRSYCDDCGYDGEEEQAVHEANLSKAYKEAKETRIEKNKLTIPESERFREYVINDYRIREDRWNETSVLLGRRELRTDRIDYFIEPHTHFSQICEGVYPPGVTRLDVLKKVEGTFGGKWVYFTGSEATGGKFKYIAWTD